MVVRRHEKRGGAPAAGFQPQQIVFFVHNFQLGKTSRLRDPEGDGQVPRKPGASLKDASEPLWGFRMTIAHPM